MTKIIKILFVISIFSFTSCSGDEESTLIDNQPIIYNDNYILEINKSYRIFKATIQVNQPVGVTVLNLLITMTVLLIENIIKLQ